LDDFLTEVCDFLHYYDEGATEKVKAKANDWFDEENLHSLIALLQVATEQMLMEAKLKFLWIYVKDLQGKSGYAPPVIASATAIAVAEKKKDLKPLSADQLTKRKAACLEEWLKHEGNTEEMLEFSDDDNLFACTACSKGEELKWHPLRGCEATLHWWRVVGQGGKDAGNVAACEECEGGGGGGRWEERRK